MAGTLTRKILVLTAGLSIAAVHAATPPLIVHEWGTFTSFQDAAGATIPGINVDDEPVPGFVHRLRDYQTFRTTSLPASWSQGAPRCYPGVTLRLETPVLYFYPPEGWQPTPFDVRATFVGGWLTEFYPSAATESMNVQASLDGRARGSLFWSQVRLDSTAASLEPSTDSPVWLAPRAVKSALVVSDATKEAEKYLFYRGVGNLDAPIVVREEGGNLHITLREGETRLERLPRLWVVEVSPNGRVRHRTLDPTGRSATVQLFSDSPVEQKSSLAQLQREMTAALTADGLYADEAAAMLATWRLSYFESEGVRVFFLLPQSWTDAKLPLSISTPANITRIMVGRVELVSPHQREVLQELYALPDESIDRTPLYARDLNALRLVQAGELSHSGLYRATGREVPAPLLLFESLGRFRDALIAHEWRSETVASRRKRLENIMWTYSACVTDPEEAQTTDAKLTSAP